jgi:hypothetical protein
MIMNPPSHRILLASVNPCYLCFGIIHLCAFASPIWMRMAGRSDPTLTDALGFAAEESERGSEGGLTNASCLAARGLEAHSCSWR